MIAQILTDLQNARIEKDIINGRIATLERQLELSLRRRQNGCRESVQNLSGNNFTAHTEIEKNTTRQVGNAEKKL
mgnify:CR=1 FL=1